MGSYYTTGASRADIIRELTEPEPKPGFFHRVEKRTTVGNVLWTVEFSGKDEESATPFIGCYLLLRDREGWGYKPMDESMGPCYYSVPESWFGLVPDPGGYATEWRAKVRAYHDNAKAPKGARVETYGGRAYTVESNTRGRIIARDTAGKLWRIQAKNIVKVSTV